MFLGVPFLGRGSPSAYSLDGKIVNVVIISDTIFYAIA